jgi:hypothetical protein
MVVGVWVSDAANAVQEREFPEHAQKRTHRDAGVTVFDTVQGTPANSAGLRQVLCAQAATDARNAHSLAKLLKIL